MSGRSAPRSKTGCTTCRRRKVKCDEQQPVCRRCSNLTLACEWAAPRTRRHRRSDASSHSSSSALIARRLRPAPPSPGASSAVATVPGSAFRTLSLPLAAHYASNTPASLRPGPAPVDWCTSPPPSSLSSSPPPPPPLLYRQMADPSTPCANSLTLSDLDRRYFQYFPSSSVVFYYMKKWQWSSFNFLYQGPAAASRVVMRLIMAMSASEMHRRRLVVRPRGRPTAEDHARYHYGTAVREFRQLLERPVRGGASVELIFATIFLMIMHEWHFGRSVAHLELHFMGVRSLLETHPDFIRLEDVNSLLLSPDMDDDDDGQAGSEARPPELISEQLLLWILYVDINCRPLGLTESLFDYIMRSNNPALHPDRLHRCARIWARCHWGRQYPDGEVADDMENYRALELLHQGMMLRHSMWDVFFRMPAGGVVDREDPEAELLFSHTLSVLDKYSDLFITAKLTSTASTRRTLNTINMAVATVYSQILLYRRLLRPPRPLAKLDRQAIHNIAEICQKQHACDARLLQRLHWPLMAAAVSTEDAAQRDWLLARLGELQGLHIEAAWAHEVAQRVRDEQLALGPGAWIDMGAILREYTIRPCDFSNR